MAWRCAGVLNRMQDMRQRYPPVELDAALTREQRGGDGPIDRERR
jgi:hypothetical protein